MTTYLFFGYAAIWTGIFLYVWSLGHRQRRLEEEVRRLQNALGEPGPPSTKGE